MRLDSNAILQQTRELLTGLVAEFNDLLGECVKAYSIRLVTRPTGLCTQNCRQRDILVTAARCWRICDW